MDTILPSIAVGVAIVAGFWLVFWRSKRPAGKPTIAPEDRESILQRVERSMDAGNSRPYYVENLAAECLRDMSKAEGWSQYAPWSGEYLKNWKIRVANVPRALELARDIEDRLRQHHEKLKAERLRSEELERQLRFKEYRQWLIDQHRSLLDRFLEVAERKVSVLDDYGDEKWDALPREIDTCLLKIAKTENDIAPDDLRSALKEDSSDALPERYCWLKSALELEFREFHEKQRAGKVDDIEFKDFTGIEFEAYLAKILKENGFENIRGTAATGDQGADLIATKDGRTIVIQAKCWKGSVGNKAVQEVVGAVSFYEADEGWVVTTGTFTPSAKALAQKSNVRLIDGYSLRKRMF